MTKIFESPDKGKTVYSREFGEDEKYLYMEDGKALPEQVAQDPKEVKQDGND